VSTPAPDHEGRVVSPRAVLAVAAAVTVLVLAIVEAMANFKLIQGGLLR
jgi:hypothetical protein